VKVLQKQQQRYFWFNEPHDKVLPDREIVVDCFAGGGGASVGLERAIGRHVDVAINHDKAAIAMHMANHPRTKHYCENLWEVDPEKVCEGRAVGAAWFSPDCTHFSKAKGKKPKRKEIRALAWIVLRWAARVRPRLIFLENVEEFVTWGPLDRKGQPVKELKGKTFEGWVRQLRELGYDVEWRTLVASDYGAPTTRKRLFLVARCDGEPITWPEPTHGSPKVIRKQLQKRGFANLQKWRTVAEIIDWSIPCPSIFLSPEEAKDQGCRRPLAEKTLKRIAEGIRRYVIKTNDPFIVKVNHGSTHFRGQPTDRPLSTVTSHNGYGVVTPFVSRMFGQSVGSSARSPVGALTQENKTALITPFVTSSAYTKSTGRGKYIYECSEALRTITTTNDKVVVTPFIQALQHGGSTRRLDHPIHTITASPKDCNLLVSPTLMSYYGPRNGSHHRGRAIDEPIPTQTTENRFALVSAFIAKHFGGMVGIQAQRPFPTITTIGTQNQLVAVNLIKNNHGAKQWYDADEPLRTIMAQGTHHAVVESRLDRVKQTQAFLFKYYGSGGQWNGLTDPAPTITSRDRLALGIVMIAGEPYQIVDIGMRMLTPRELFNAQGFPGTYDITTGVNGKPATKTEQVARCGNSVSPHPAEALVSANFQPVSIGAEVAS